MNKVWKEIQEKYNFDTISYDLDMDEDEVEKYEVGDKLPVFIFQDDNNNELFRIIGEKKIEEMEKIMKEHEII
jgi:hypothetical protein